MWPWLCIGIMIGLAVGSILTALIFEARQKGKNNEASEDND